MNDRQVVRVMRLRRRVTALEDALRALIEARPLPSANADEVRCVYCGAAGSNHADECPWARARALLDATSTDA